MKTKKQIVNFSTILLLLFSILVASCKVDEPNPTDIRMDVYPNPASDNVRLSVVPANTGRSKITVLTIDGKRMIEINNGVTEAGKNYVKNIDVSKLVSGVYMIQLTSGYKTTIKKVIIAR